VTLFECARGAFALERRPPVTDGRLQAHDAADALLIEYAGDDFGVVMLVNDSFGALAVATSGAPRTSWSDSVVAHLATADNLAANGLPSDVVMLASTELPPRAFDTVLWRLPRSIDALRAQSAALRTVGARRVLAGGMDKHLPATFLAFLRTQGTVTVHPGRRKAHVYEVVFDPTTTGPAARPQVFGRERVDAGTQLLIDALHDAPMADRIADLCCGTGVLGLALQGVRSHAEVHYFDESYQAVAVARAAVGRDDLVHAADGFGDTATTFDLIVCNPPFHQGNVVGDDVARDLFRQSAARLTDEGELWVVGNRHLNYHRTLRQAFGAVRQVASHPKFVVLAASGPRR
jgi:23S rRNA (guanine1835-N2)-methyltransferase